MLGQEHDACGRSSDRRAPARRSTGFHAGSLPSVCGFCPLANLDAGWSSTSASPISRPGWSSARGSCPWSSTSGPTGAGRAASSPRRSRPRSASAPARSSWRRSMSTRTRRLPPPSAIQGIPAVKAFRDGAVVAEFTGALPPAQIEAFLDDLLPSPADQLAEADDESSLRRALDLDPRHPGAARKLGRLLLARGEAESALELLEPLHGDFLAEGLVARARLGAANGGTASTGLDSPSPPGTRVTTRRPRAPPGRVRRRTRSRSARPDPPGDGRPSSPSSAPTIRSRASTGAASRRRFTDLRVRA